MSHSAQVLPRGKTKLPCSPQLSAAILLAGLTSLSHVACSYYKAETTFSSTVWNFKGKSVTLVLSHIRSMKHDIWGFPDPRRKPTVSLVPGRSCIEFLGNTAPATAEPQASRERELHDRATGSSGSQNKNHRA